MAGRETGELMHPNLSERFSETLFWFGKKASSISRPQVPQRSQEDKEKVTDVRLSGVSVCKDPKAQPLLSWRCLLLRSWLRWQESFEQLDEQVGEKINHLSCPVKYVGLIFHSNQVPWELARLRLLLLPPKLLTDVPFPRFASTLTLMKFSPVLS